MGLPFMLWITTYVSAELILVLVRAGDIQLILKKADQRKKQEQELVNRGLIRSVLLEMFLFVPASVTLVLLVVAPLIESADWRPRLPGHSMYAALGISSYGFPFAVIRRAVTRIALNTLREFAELMPDGASSSKGA